MLCRGRWRGVRGWGGERVSQRRGGHAVDVGGGRGLAAHGGRAVARLGEHGAAGRGQGVGGGGQGGGARRVEQVGAQVHGVRGGAMLGPSQALRVQVLGAGVSGGGGGWGFR